MAKFLSNNLQALFTSNAAYNYAGLYQFNLASAGSLYYSSADVDIYLNSADADGDPFWNNQRFSSGGSIGPYFDRKDNKAKMHQIVGLQTDTLTFDVIPGAATINGAPFLSAIRAGVFDAAELIYLGAFWPVGDPYSRTVVPTGTIKKYVGRVAEVDCSRNLATFTINSYLELLDQNMPRNLFQATCVNTLYDASCTVNQSAFTVAGTVLSGSTASAIKASVVPVGNSRFPLGVVAFTSGVNNGVSRTVKSYSNGTIQLIAPFPSVPSAGDTFDISAGCDLLQATCAVCFNNLQNFRGFPFVPQQENAS